MCWAGNRRGVSALCLVSTRALRIGILFLLVALKMQRPMCVRFLGEVRIAQRPMSRDPGGVPDKPTARVDFAIRACNTWPTDPDGSGVQTSHTVFVWRPGHCRHTGCPASKSIPEKRGLEDRDWGLVFPAPNPQSPAGWSGRAALFDLEQFQFEYKR